MASRGPDDALGCEALCSLSTGPEARGHYDHRRAGDDLHHLVHITPSGALTRPGQMIHLDSGKCDRF
ncbi:MAG: hypothetical protein WCG47_17325, partial [Dermatophilaceae bacterium]